RLALAVLARSLAPARADDAKATDDLKKMQGTWVGATPEGEETRWVIKDDTLKAKVGKAEYACTITLDPKAAPHPSADFTLKTGPDDLVGKVSKAIYKFDGGKLILCVTHPGAENRPAEFKSAEGQHFLFEL